MDPEHREKDRESRRRKYDDETEGRSKQRKRYRDDERPEKKSRRQRSRERDSRRRSRSPDSRDRRSHSRNGERRREKERDNEWRSSRDKGREGSDRERGGDSERSRRERDRESGVGRSRHGRRHRNSDDEDSPEQHSDGVKPDSGRSLVKRNGPLPSQSESFAITNGEEPEKPVEKPNFGNSGALAAASNTITQADGSTVTLKYHEPPEARKPAPRDIWKLFVFKGPDILDTIELSARSCWLIGRDSAVVDLPAEHPSISKQHAVIQFRYTEKRNEYGDRIGKVKPYLIDLESANGTLLNNNKVPESRYLELRDKDMIQFGSSTREYVLMLAPRN
ncbi:SMAD/FHA domain-containing protein [Podospora aff. communis PSN243]|uniref:SMAD/FHA domain-containing protein n=1 Tax=Podospora aff. communis PSN243 TaxID=3040156 RepID=A0AAV9GCG0_9PEZI|nr:SMAD/FHA domain-containing protein [Podospora aff. communis PSN243]